MNKIVVYISFILAIVLFNSCEDKYKDELNQVKKDLEEVKKENEDLKAEKSKLEGEQAELAKLSQKDKLESVVNWYIRSYILKDYLAIDKKSVTIKNIFKEDRLDKTEIIFNDLERLPKLKGIVSQTLNHTYDSEGVLIKSECTLFSMDWNWVNAEDVKVLFKDNENQFYVYSNKRNIVSKVEYLNETKEVIGKQLLEYNEANNLVKIEFYKFGSKRVGYYYEYNDKQLLLSFKVVDVVRAYRNNEFTFEYDSNDRMTRIYNKKDNHVEEKLYEYGKEFIYKEITKQLNEAGEIISSNNKIYKYTNESLETPIYKKEEDHLGYYTECEYENGIIIKKEEKIQFGGSYRFNVTTHTIKDGKLIERKVDLEIRYSSTDELHQKIVTTYTDIKIKEGEKLSDDFDTGIFSEYIIKTEELVEGKLTLKSKLKKVYVKNEYGYWELKSETNLMEE